jgi:hypothetical protein
VIVGLVPFPSPTVVTVRNIESPTVTRWGPVVSTFFEESAGDAGLADTLGDELATAVPLCTGCWFRQASFVFAAELPTPEAHF